MIVGGGGPYERRRQSPMRAPAAATRSLGTTHCERSSSRRMSGPAKLSRLATISALVAVTTCRRPAIKLRGDGVEKRRARARRAALVHIGDHDLRAAPREFLAQRVAPLTPLDEQDSLPRRSDRRELQQALGIESVHRHDGIRVAPRRPSARAVAGPTAASFRLDRCSSREAPKLTALALVNTTRSNPSTELMRAASSR